MSSRDEICDYIKSVTDRFATKINPDRLIDAAAKQKARELT